MWSGRGLNPQSTTFQANTPATDVAIYISSLDKQDEAQKTKTKNH
jgi:hypothetical protein